MTILISQTISEKKYNQSRIHIFKYDLEKIYKMNKIKVFIKAKIMQIPNYINRVYILSIKMDGLELNHGWLTSFHMNFKAIDNIIKGLYFMKDCDININNLRARYVHIRVTDSQPPVLDSDIDTNKNKYQNAKIYVIRSCHTDKIYIGSTIRTLARRFGKHRSLHNYTTSKKVIDYGDAYIELLELYPCDSSVELHKRENEYILSHKENVVNRYLPDMTEDKNNEAKQKYRREYRIKNKEKISAQNKLWRDAKKRAANPDASL